MMSIAALSGSQIKAPGSAGGCLPGLRITNYRRRAVIAFLVDTEAQIVSIVGAYYGGRDYEAILRGDSEDDQAP